MSSSYNNCRSYLVILHHWQHICWLCLQITGRRQQLWPQCVNSCKHCFLTPLFMNNPFMQEHRTFDYLFAWDQITDNVLYTQTTQLQRIKWQYKSCISRTISQFAPPMNIWNLGFIKIDSVAYDTVVINL